MMSFLSILNVYLDHFTLTKLSVESGSVRVEVIFENICWNKHITGHISVHEQNHASQQSSESQHNIQLLEEIPNNHRGLCLNLS